MHRTVRRALTVAAAGGGALVLLAGPAAAHYCYITDPAPGLKQAKGQPWMTPDEAKVMFASFLEGACETAVLARIDALPPDTRFMGPGLLAGGAVQQGKSVGSFGHLIEDPSVSAACG